MRLPSQKKIGSQTGALKSHTLIVFLLIQFSSPNQLKRGVTERA